MLVRCLFRSALALVILTSTACSKKEEERVAAPQERVARCTSPLTSNDVTLPPEEVQPVVLAHQQILGHCYDQELRRNPTLQGRIDVHLVIEANGTASQVCAGDVTLPSEAVTSCVLRAFQTFSYSPYGEQVATIYPVEFAAH